jgi:hypothetical protein
MSLPAVIHNVKYKVAGKYAYKGEFVITAGVIYYLPHTDLIQRRINTAVSAMSGVAGGMAGRMIRDLKLPDHDDKRNRVLRGRESSLILQQKLDAYIRELKETRSSVTLSTALPLPMRYAKDDVKNLLVKPMGSVFFKAGYDTHLYKTGLLRRKYVMRALTEAGFISC